MSTHLLQKLHTPSNSITFVSSLLAYSLCRSPSDAIFREVLVRLTSADALFNGAAFVQAFAKERNMRATIKLSGVVMKNLMFYVEP